MPVGSPGMAQEQLVRRVRVVRGRVSFHLECHLAFDYARTTPEVDLAEHGARFQGLDLTLGLVSSIPLERSPGGVVADFTLGEGESVAFVLRRLVRDSQLTCCPGGGQSAELFRATVECWRRWLSRCP